VADVSGVAAGQRGFLSGTEWQLAWDGQDAGAGKGQVAALPACQGVDLEGLLVDLERCEAALRELGLDGTVSTTV